MPIGLSIGAAAGWGRGSDRCSVLWMGEVTGVAAAVKMAWPNLIGCEMGEGNCGSV